MSAALYVRKGAAVVFEHGRGILIKMLTGAATRQQTVMGIMEVMTEMACQCSVYSECLLFRVLENLGEMCAEQHKA